MAATNTLDWEFSEVENEPDDAINDEVFAHEEHDVVKVKYQIVNLKAALSASKVALITEQEKNAKDELKDLLQQILFETRE